MKPKSLLLMPVILLATLANRAHAVDDLVLADIQARVGAMETKMIGWRRDIHQHPELANQEHRTAALVADQHDRAGVGLPGTRLSSCRNGCVTGRV